MITIHGEGDATQLHGDRRPCTWDLPRPRPVYRFLYLSAFFTVSLHILVNVMCFPTSISRSSKLIKPEEGIVGTSNSSLQQPIGGMSEALVSKVCVCVCVLARVCVCVCLCVFVEMQAVV